MANANHYLTPLFHVCYLTFVCLGLATTLLWDFYFESK